MTIMDDISIFDKKHWVPLLTIWYLIFWSNQKNKNGREILFLLTLRQHLSHSFFAVDDSALMLLIFVIYHPVFAQINYWGHSRLEINYFLLIFTFIASVYGVGESGATVWDPNLLSEMLELLASLSDERLMSPCLALPGCQGEGRCWHCRGRATTESTARLSSAAVTALWSSQGV